jgi:metal iron transporter
MPHNLYLHSFIVQARCREWRSQRPRVVKNGESWLVKSDPLRQGSNDIKEPIESVNSNEKGSTIPAHTLITVVDDNASCVSRTGINFEKLSKYLDSSLKRNLHYGFIDLIVALTFAFFVNCSILIVASANFYYGPSNQNQQVQDLFSAHALLMQYLGPPAAVVFALALLCAGQSSTLTATLAGQGKNH